jgi:hypothetical protein
MILIKVESIVIWKIDTFAWLMTRWMHCNLFECKHEYQILKQFGSMFIILDVI